MKRKSIKTEKAESDVVNVAKGKVEVAISKTSTCTKSPQQSSSEEDVVERHRGTARLENWDAEPGLETEPSVREENVVEVCKAESPLSPEYLPVAAGGGAIGGPIKPLSPIASDVHESLLGDVTFPRLNLVANVGQLAQVFQPGSWVYQRAIALGGPGQALNVICLGISRKRWFRRPENPNEPLVWAESEKEAVALGGTVLASVARQRGIPLFRPYSVVYFAIEKPEWADEKAETVYSFDIGGRKFALVAYGVTGTAYGAVVKQLLVARFFGVLARGWPNYYWRLGAKKVAFSRGWAWVPELTVGGAVPPEIAAAAKEIVSTLGRVSLIENRDEEPGSEVVVETEAVVNGGESVDEAVQ